MFQCKQSSELSAIKPSYYNTAIFLETNLRNVGSGSDFTVDAVLQSAGVSNQHQRSASSSSGANANMGQAGPSQVTKYNDKARHLTTKQFLAHFQEISLVLLCMACLQSGNNATTTFKLICHTPLTNSI